MLMSGLSPILILLCLAALSRRASSYPILAQVDEGDERCFRFNIPQDDDASMVFLVIPNEDEVTDEALETWYIEQVYKLTKAKSEQGVIPKQIKDDAPEAVSKLMSDFLQESGGNASPIMIKLSSTMGDSTHYTNNLKAKYFVPVVVNQIKKSNERNARKRNINLDNVGHTICLANGDRERQAQVIYDIVLISEEIVDDEGNFKDKHLTPLEESLDQSIVAANSVLREMRYMEKREQRMRLTADSINTRVRWFSYLSVAVLLSVTYVQVTYLKRYFHKKKLM